MPVILKDEKVIDTWGLVIESGAGKEDYLLEKIESYLEYAEVPEITWETVQAASTRLKSLLGKKQPCLMVTNAKLPDFRMYIRVANYGRHLNVSWFLTVEPAIFKRAFSELFTQGEDAAALSFAELDLFTQEDLRAYVTITHRFAVRRAVEELLKEIGQEPSKVDWQSKGFLKVW